MDMTPLTEEQRTLVAENQKLAAWVVHNKFNFPQDKRDDFVSVAYIGLCKAARSFIPEYKIKFATYASRVVYNEIAMALRGSKKHRAQILTCDLAAVREEDGAEIDFFEFAMGTEDKDPEAYKFLHDAVEKTNLTEVERKIIDWMFFEKLNREAVTQRFIAENNKISQSYVSRLRMRALEKIRRTLLNDGEMPPANCEEPGNTRREYREQYNGKYMTSAPAQPKVIKDGDYRPHVSDAELAERGLVRVRNENGKIWYKKVEQVWKETATDEELQEKGFYRKNGRVYKIQPTRTERRHMQKDSLGRPLSQGRPRKYTDEELAAQGKHRTPTGQVVKNYVAKPLKEKKEMPYLNRLCATKNKYELVQKVALDFLSEIEIYYFSARGDGEQMEMAEKPEDFIDRLFRDMKKKYQLAEDPFTRMLCTTIEYCKSSREYDRQLSIDKYGYDIADE